MKKIELDQEAIKKSIASLEKLDFKTASIQEIEDLLFPLFKGYTVSAPSFDTGLYLYRSRICTKPNYLHELSYPSKEHILEYGRANNIGQPMFYGSISKNIPLFELNAKVGDRLFISIWKTKAKLLINHIGFSDEVFKLLNSNREGNSLYQFVSNTRNFNDINTFVYNYLAAAFAKKIQRTESYLYRLSIAITNKLLMGDLLDGVIYPTIAMNGNSDNIVIKPSYVDVNMDFVAVEYLEVTEVKDMQYKIQILDSANEIQEGKLIWTGKMLGWTLEGKESMSLNSDGSDWIAKDINGNRSDPKPTTIIQPNISRLEREYINIFSHAFKISEDIHVESIQDDLNVKCTLLLDFESKSRFLSIYIPKSINPINILEALLQNIDYFLKMDKDIIECKDEISGEVLCTNKDLIFSNKIYLYSESSIDPNNFNHKGFEIDIQNG
jgi:hypothetical protein